MPTTKNKFVVSVPVQFEVEFTDLEPGESATAKQAGWAAELAVYHALSLADAANRTTDEWDDHLDGVGAFTLRLKGDN